MESYFKQIMKLNWWFPVSASPSSYKNASLPFDMLFISLKQNVFMCYAMYLVEHDYTLIRIRMALVVWYSKKFFILFNVQSTLLFNTLRKISASAVCGS